MILLSYMIHTWCFSAFPGLGIPLNKRTHSYLASFIYTWFCWQGPFCSVGPSLWGLVSSHGCSFSFPEATSRCWLRLVRHLNHCDMTLLKIQGSSPIFHHMHNSGVTWSLVQPYADIQCWFHFCLLRRETNSEKSLTWGLELSLHSRPVKKG